MNSLPNIHVAIKQTLLVDNDIWVYENGVFIGTLNTSLNATTAYARYPIDFGKANQLPINVVLKHGSSNGNGEKGQSVAVVVQLSSGILSISVTLPSSFKSDNKVALLHMFLL